MQKSEKGERLKAAFLSKRGFWPEEYEGLAAFCPDFLESHLNSSVIGARSELISPLLSEYIAIAIDASTTHLFEPGLRIHIRNALRLGATGEQIALVLEIVSIIGTQSQLIAFPILADIKKDAFKQSELSTEEQRLKEDFTSVYGVWTDDYELVLRASPAYFAAHLQMCKVIQRSDALTPREKALILVATNAAVTHMPAEPLRFSMLAALEAGASTDDVIHVIRRVSTLGIHASMFGFPILLEELARHESVEGH